jgi:hypothetical protein
MLREAFPLYDEVAMGGSGGPHRDGAGRGHDAMLLEPAREFVPVLSLLGNYLFGYAGLLARPRRSGVVASGLLGFASGGPSRGSSTCSSVPRERDLERRLATLTTLEGWTEGGRLER